MLIHPTSERLIALGFTGMAKALDEQRHAPTTFDSLGFEERLASGRSGSRRTRHQATDRRLKFAALRRPPVSRISTCAPRAASIAPSWLTWSMAHGSGATRTCSSPARLVWEKLGRLRARPQGLPRRPRRRYHRVGRLFEALAIARGDGRHARMLKVLARTDLLILDDWGLAVLTSPERRDMLEILEDRHGRGSTIVTSQLPVEHWHDAIGDRHWPTPFWTGSSTMPTVCPSPEKACGSAPPR